MSAEAFRNVMKNIPELKEWASGQRDTSSFVHSTRNTSKKEIENSIVDFVLPVGDLVKIVGDPGIAAKILGTVKSDPDPFINLVKTDSGGQVIIFKEIRFGNLNSTIAGYLANLADDATIKEQVTEAVKYFGYDKGHVYGWANTLVQRTKQSIGDTLKARNTSPEILEKELAALDSFVDRLSDVLEELDQAASSLGKDLNSKVFAKYRKTDKNWLIQWQGSTEQQGAGSKVATLLGKSNSTGVRGFLNSVGYQSSENMVSKALQTMVQGFLKQGLQENNKNLAQLKSSPKLIELLEDTIMSSATGRKKKYKDQYTGTINLPDLNVQKAVGVDRAKASITKAKGELAKIKSDTKRAKEKVKKQKVSQSNGTVNLVSLQNLLNAQLQDVVSANMGSGSSRNVLNYRTGRFASSAEVKRLTISREGMITAFYTYMKSPYATFSTGGQQEYPRSRDPKLLISSSIRQIAGQMLENRLRAVVV